MEILTQEQANFILSSRIKNVTPSIVREFNSDDGYDAFKEMRWGWTGGKAICPHCHHERLYEFADRDKFKCKKCGRQFSTTTKTAFKSRKLEHKTYIAAISQKIHRPGSIVELAEFLAVNYRTAHRLDKIMGLIRSNISVRARDRVWPYAPYKPEDDGANVVQVVNHQIPKNIPEHIRADICQEIILGVLEGGITLDDVAKQTSKYVRKFWGKVDWEFAHLSIDQTRQDGRSWHDVLEDKHAKMDGEDRTEWFVEQFGYEPLDKEKYGYGR